MRMIGLTSAEAPARRFCDYLLTRGIAAHAEAAEGGWQIWVEHDDQLDAGRTELQHFAAAPDHSRYNSAADAQRLRASADHAARRRRANFTHVRTAGFAAGKTTPVTVTIIFVTIILGALMKFGDDPSSPLYHALLFNDPQQYSATFDGVPGMFDSIRHAQPWRLLTPIFIHYGPFHLLFNMMWMFDLGKRIEPQKGGGRLIGLIVLIALISCSAQGVWMDYSHGPDISDMEFGGMSGVVAGLFGYAWMCGHFRPYERVGVTQYETGLMIGWLVICTFGIVGPIANAAHWGGLLTGMAIGAAPTLVKRPRRN